MPKRNYRDVPTATVKTAVRKSTKKPAKPRKDRTPHADFGLRHGHLRSYSITDIGVRMTFTLSSYTQARTIRKLVRRLFGEYNVARTQFAHLIRREPDPKIVGAAQARVIEMHNDIRLKLERLPVEVGDRLRNHFTHVTGYVL
jgi:hypothetical protein